jgi:hypothetical protein
VISKYSLKISKNHFQNQLSKIPRGSPATLGKLPPLALPFEEGDPKLIPKTPWETKSFPNTLWEITQTTFPKTLWETKKSFPIPLGK